MIILLLCSFTVVLAITAVFFYQYFTFRDQLLRVSSECNRLKKDLRTLGSSVIGVGQRLNTLEEYLQRLSYRQNEAELKQGASASYAHASKIVEIGGSIDDIMQGCGLTRAEAELVMMLHKKPQYERS